MAVRLDAAADRLSHQGAYPAINTGFTITMWVRIDVDQNNFTTFARLHDTGTLCTFSTESDGMVGPSHFTTSGSAALSGVMASTVGIWVPVATSRAAGGAGANGVVDRRVDGGTTTTSANGALTGGAGATPSGICIGGRGGDAGASPDSSEWLNGSVAHVRIFTGELSQAEKEAEWASATPVKTGSLFEAWKLDDASDLTGVNGRVLVVQAGGAIATTDGPALTPVSYPAPYQFPAPGRVGPGSRAFGWFGTGDAGSTAAPSVAETGTAPVGTATSAQTVKVAAVSGVAGVGTVARAGAAKRSLSSGTVSVGPVLSGVVCKLGVTRGSAAAGPVASSSTLKRGVTVGSAPVGTATGATARKLGVSRGLAAVGTVTGSSAAKRATTVGLVAVGSAATVSRALIRAVSAVIGVGVASAATVAKRAATAGSAPAGPTLTSTPRKLAATRGLAAVGTVTLRSGVLARAVSAVTGVGTSLRAVVARRAAVTGVAATGPVARATPGRRASVAAVAGVGPATLASAARRAAVRALAAVATVLSWNKSLGAPKTQVRAGTPLTVTSVAPGAPYAPSSGSVAGVPLDAAGAPEPGPPAGA